METNLIQAESPVLEPLQAFYAEAGRALPAIEAIDSDATPEPYRTLLVHHRDMTSALEAFHSQPIALQPRVMHRRDDLLSREVLLVGERDGRPVEYGAITIELSAFPEAAQAEVIEAKRPLGAILHDYGIAHRSEPSAFLRVVPDEHMRTVLHMNGCDRLYGRCNVLRRDDHAVLARVVEILPPTERTS